MKDFKVYQASGYLTKLVADASDVRKVYEEISGSLVQFDTPISAPLESLIVDINPVQDLHGQDAPYPAGGGVNKWDEEWEAGGINSSGGNSSTSGYYRSKNYIPILPSTSYYFKAPVSMAIYYYDSEKTYIERTFQYNAVITTPINASYIMFRNSNENEWTPYNNDISINYPSTDTAYHPYSNICPITGWTGANIYHSGEDTSDPTVYTVSWQDEAGTVYGGTLDVVSGVLTVDRAKATRTWSQFTSKVETENNVEGRVTGLGILNSERANTICDKLRYDSNGTASCFYVSTNSSNNGYIRAFFNPTPQDSDEFSFVYYIAEPFTIQLTPQEINTLTGVNNIWADTGDVSVKYRTH